MPAGTPFIGNLATVTVNSVSISNVKDITPPNISVGMVEATPLGATVKNKLAALIDSGDFTVNLWYDPADTSHAGLEALIGDPAVPVLITLKTGHTLGFNAFVTGFDITGLGTETPVEAAVKFAVTGLVTFTHPA